jgi:hypothetical protein
MSEIKITGKKAIKTINKEFQEKFPYLMIIFMHPDEWEKSRKIGGTRTGIPGDTRLSEARTITPKSSSEISIHGKTKVKNLEDAFVKTYGLHLQICFGNPKGEFFYTSTQHDEMSLTQLNKLFEEQGMKKNLKWNSY